MKDYLEYSNNKVKINYINVGENIGIIKNYNNKDIIAVIKNDAYNLGIEGVVQECIKNNVTSFAVANLEEALRVRKISTSAMVLILNPIENELLHIASENKFDLIIPSFEQLNIYNEFLVKNSNCNLKFHVKFNCGMNRYGFTFDEIGNLINEIKKMPIIKNIRGLMTHFPQADETDLTVHNSQVESFIKVYDMLKDIIKFEYIHGENSEAFLLKDSRLSFCNYSRIGVLLYGYVPMNIDIKLKPTMFLENKIINIRTLKKGEYLGYGDNKVTRDCIVGLCPLGYGDGVIGERNKAPVYINGKKYKILGTISMSHMYIELDNTVKVADKVEIFGENIRFDEVPNVTISRLMCSLKRL